MFMCLCVLQYVVNNVKLATLLDNVPPVMTASL